MKWNAAAQEWQRADQEIDEDFIASYQANYGVPYDYSKFFLTFPSMSFFRALLF